MRRTGLFFIVVLLLLALFFGKRCTRFPFFSLSVYEAIPTSTSLFFKSATPPWSGEKKSANDWEAIFPGIQGDLDIFRAWEKQVPLIKNAKRKPYLTIIEPTSAGDLRLALVLDKKNMQNDLDQVLENWPKDKKEESRLKGVTLYHLSLESGERVSLCQYRNLVVMSSLPLLVEEAIKQLDQPDKSIRKNPQFRKIIPSTKNAKSFSLFLNTNFLTSFFREILREELIQQLSQWQTHFNWLRLDIEVEENGWKVNGQFLPVEGEKFISLLSTSEKALDRKGFHFMPEGTNSFFYWNLRDLKNYYKKVADQKIDRFTRFILPWVEEELVLFSLGNSNTGKCVLLKYKDEQFVHENLDRLAEEVGVLDDYNYNIFQVKQVLAEDLWPFQSGEAVVNPFYTFIDGYVLMAASRSTIESCLDRYIVSKTLVNKPGFVNFLQNNATDLPFLGGLYTEGASILVNQYSKPNDYLNRLPAITFLGQFDFLGLGIKEKKGFGELEGFWPYAIKEQRAANIAWKRALEARVLGQPKVVEVGGNKFIAVQDEMHTLYLMSSSGAIIWKKKLDGPMFGGVELIHLSNRETDFLLCNTPSSIYMVDLDGANWGPGPIQLQVQATAKVKAIDFDKNEAYLFFVPGDNGEYYGYDLEGLFWEGWNSLPINGIITHPMAHFQDQLTDYLVMQDTSGRLGMFNKFGKAHFPMLSLQGQFLSPPAFQVSDSLKYAVTTDASGWVNQVDLAGKHFLFQLLVGNNQNIRHVFADFVRDPKKDHLVWTQNNLALYFASSKGWERAFAYVFESNQEDVFAVEISSRAQALIGSLDKNKQQIHLLDQRGQLVNGFPLAGTTAFSITDLMDDGQNIVLVGNGASVYAYQVGLLE